MKKKLFIALFFACFGLSCEICFVAFTNLINNTPFCDEPLLSLTGKTYVWMIPIYIMIPIFGDKIMIKIQKINRIYRLLIYVFIIYTIEFISAWFLEIITGTCPWKYTSGLHISGYIRLDYFPAWLLFAFIIESLYIYLNKNLKE